MATISKLLIQKLKTEYSYNPKILEFSILNDEGI